MQVAVVENVQHYGSTTVEAKISRTDLVQDHGQISNKRCQISGGALLHSMYLAQEVLDIDPDCIGCHRNAWGSSTYKTEKAWKS